VNGGQTWTLQASASTALLIAIWGSESQDIYAVGLQPGLIGTILHKQ
jgi:hypothetical protein